MATFSGAIALLTGTFNSSIPSSNGSVVANNTIYTAPAGRKTIINFTNFFNNLNGTSTVAFKIQRKDPQTGSYVHFMEFSCSGTGGSSTPFALSMAQSSIQALINNGVAELNGAAPDAAGNVRIVLMPEDRIQTVSGSTQDGSSLRVMGRTEEYYSSF